jgi:hypothetical protein
VITQSDKISFIKKVFGSTLVDRACENIAVHCPKCKSQNSKKKLSINLATWQTHCWVCGLKGKTLLPVLRKYSSQCNVSEFERRFLGNRREIYDVPIIEDEKIKIPNGFILLADHIGKSDPDAKACLRYLFSRGITERDLWYYKMGTAKSGKFRRSIIIPSFDFYGDLNYFVTRKIDADNKFKYINAKADKKKIIFNEINIDWSQEVTLVEGPFDLVKSNDNATCLLGSSLTEKMLLFKRIVTQRTPVLLALDSDMKKKSLQIAETLMSYDCNVRLLSLGEKSDVGEMTSEEFEKARRSAKAWNRNFSLKSKIAEINSGSII